MSSELKRKHNTIESNLPVNVDKLLNWLNNEIHMLSLMGFCECNVTVFTNFVRINLDSGFELVQQLEEEQRELLTLFLLAKPEGLEYYQIDKSKLINDEFTLRFRWKHNPEYIIRKRLKAMLDNPYESLDNVHDTLLEYLK